MIHVLPRVPKGRRGHDVSRGIDSLSSINEFAQLVRDLAHVGALPRDRSERIFQSFPSIDTIKNLEEDRPEKDLVRCLRPIGAILNFADKVLTDPIRCPVGVGKSMSG